MLKEFKNEGPIPIDNIQKVIEIDINKLSDGINTFKEHFIIKKNDLFEIFERKCDHANGKLICINNKIHCPLHGWEFNPESKKYINVNLEKVPINYKINNNKIIFKSTTSLPKLPQLKNKMKIEVEVEFISHAFLIIKTHDFSFAMDPWADGPAFAGGWWLKSPPAIGWQKKLNNCDFIYISHNHPDHLHIDTLKNVDKNMLFIIPNFLSKSVYKILYKNGFKNICVFDFQNYYRYKKTDLLLSILKSGDFRDDSGLYFTFNNFSFLSTVDANNLNWNNFPKDITLFTSSFASGASGYPLCHEQINHQTRIKYIARNKKSDFNITVKNVNQIKPKYFMPYAGFFSENAKRDNYIKTNNKKNVVTDYEKVIKKHKVLNVENYNKYTFINNQLAKSEKNVLESHQDNPEDWIKSNMKNLNISSKVIVDYFKKSSFNANLILILSLTDDMFIINENNYKCDFTKTPPQINKISKNKINDIKSNKTTTSRLLFIKAREDAFSYLIQNRLPWEDLSIGFQCKINRIPDQYNSDFWFHFTNNYF